MIKFWLFPALPFFSGVRGGDVFDGSSSRTFSPLPAGAPNLMASDRDSISAKATWSSRRTSDTCDTTFSPWVFQDQGATWWEGKDVKDFVC